jgi:ketosteroid isomerase-like protein
MSEESATTGLVELTRRSFAAANRRDWDTLMGFFARDAVWEAQEFQAFEGRTAIRGFVKDLTEAYDRAVEFEVEDVSDLGAGIVFVSASAEGRLADSTAHMRVRMGAVYSWADNLIVRVASYPDIAEGRAAAERLAEERG